MLTSTASGDAMAAAGAADTDLTGAAAAVTVGKGDREKR